METRQDASITLIPPHALSELRQFLSSTGTTLTIADAVSAAIHEWLTRQPAAAQPHRGYQWKQLFLPAGTELRMSHKGQHYYAKVQGDQLIFRQQVVTPRAMVLAIAGDGRNAWRDLWLRLPQQGQWMNAARLRRLQIGQELGQANNPAAALSAAATAMNQALKSAVSLIEHVDYQSTTVLERRLPKNRRAIDLLEDID